MDGVGEFATTSIWKGCGKKLTKLKQINFPDSIGLLYSTITAFLGFKVNSGEYKVMGLAPYGRPIYKDKLLEMVILNESEGTFRLNMKFFSFAYSDIMYTKALEAHFGFSARDSESELVQKHMDLAASIQAFTEDMMVRLAQITLNMSDSTRLCLAGGVALNCVGNGKIQRVSLKGRMWIQPASGDAGTALGAALGYYHHILGEDLVSRNEDSMCGSYLGPAYEKKHVEAMIREFGAVATELDDEKLLNLVTDKLASGFVVGWHQDRAEFGPRSLGNRSILGDPRNINMQTTMNLKIKYRESFRPLLQRSFSQRLVNIFRYNPKVLICY